MSTTGSSARVDLQVEKIERLAEERLSAGQARLFRPFLSQYFVHAAPDDVTERHVDDLYGATMAHLATARRRQAGETIVHAYSPDVDRHGYSSPRSVVEIVGDDMPFLVDSVTMEIARHGLGVYFAVHPVMRVVRDGTGELVEVLPPNGPAGALGDPDTTEQKAVPAPASRAPEHGAVGGAGAGSAEATYGPVLAPAAPAAGAGAGAGADPGAGAGPAADAGDAGSAPHAGASPERHLHLHPHPDVDPHARTHPDPDPDLDLDPDPDPDLGPDPGPGPHARTDAGTHAEHQPEQPADQPHQQGIQESFIRIEVDREQAPALEELRADLLRVLGDVRAAVEDWPAMRARAHEIAAALDADAGCVAAGEREESTAFLEWLADGHFVFLGYREYEFVAEDEGEVLRSVDGSGLGILRGKNGRPTSHSYSKLPLDVRRRARQPNLLNLTKANSRSTVHRRSYLDYIGIKRFDETGVVVGERRFLGLYTTNVYKQWPQDIPILRRTVRAVTERAGFPDDSHSGKALVEVIDEYPRDELFQMNADELYEATMAILAIQGRQRLRLLVRHDQFGRFVSCLVFLPHERLTPELEQRIQDILKEAFHGVHLEQSTSIFGVLVRVHLIIYTQPGSLPALEVDELEARLVTAMRTWGEELHEALLEDLGEELGNLAHRRYGNAFSAAYVETVSPRAAVSDIRHIDALGEAGFGVNLYRPVGAAGGTIGLKVFRSGQRITLSGVLPVLENMGLQVVDERPYQVTPEGSRTVFVYDFGLRHAGEVDLEDSGVRQRFHEAFGLVWSGKTENDAFNRLVLSAGLSAREVSVLRTYAKYLRQAGTSSDEDFIAGSLAANARLATLLVQLFRTRFDPGPETAESRGAACREVASAIERGLDSVSNLNEDRVVRRMLGTVLATVRTNFFQRGKDGQPKPWLAIKLDSRKVPGLPLPLPMFEAFVCSPAMEGIHLRGGWIARGGIRWSDRLEDYRTEVLGLMKAQTVKNSVIVPDGAKGGFVVKAPAADDAERAAQGVECYQTLVRGLLDITDNLVGGKIVPPEDVVRHDGDDAYLVVAADKGTATFSDIANELAEERGFWLGDAFASGGSAGYDHKAMGITARGAWISVRRHLRDLGIDPAAKGITAVGIGDMSGDVFGNGMLLEPNLRLIAAFDHRDIFLDPEPDPSVSLAERRRLFALPRSSWEDYDESLVSTGGGIWGRNAKSIRLSSQARHALDIDAETLTPDELIQAILRAPVDLLWNGGVGTYVRASEESNAEVGDKSNDTVRVTANELRCRIVGEGGNLGFTQLARVEFAERGGRIFTDAIDNSAGVDTSDHEVNIKILLDKLVTDGALTARQRDELLGEMADEVARHVLADNEGQTLALTLATFHAHSMAPVHLRLLASLERSGQLNRAVEYLPSGDELRERIEAGGGLTPPELAVLLAYAKSDMYTELLASDVPEDPFLAQELQHYFPAPLRARYSAEMWEHALRREIIATRLTNEVVNRAGMTFAYRLADETGLGIPDAVRAHASAHEIFGVGPIWSRTERLGADVPVEVQREMFLEARTLTERGGRRLLHKRPQPLDVAETVEHYTAGLRELADHLPEFLTGRAAEQLAGATARLVRFGVPEALASRAAGLPVLLAGLDVVDIAAAGGCGLAETAAVYFALGEVLSLDWLDDQIAALPREDRWHALARGAFREDLYAARATITQAVLAGTAAGETAASRTEAWIAQRGKSAGHCRASIDEIVASGRADLATLSVALREIRSLPASLSDS